MSEELYEACRAGDVATVQACLARGEDVNAKRDGVTPLMAAVWGNNIEIARILLARDNLDIAATNSSGLTALHWACMMNYAGCVALLG